MDRGLCRFLEKPILEESFPDVNEPASFDVQETGNKSGLLHTIELFGFDNVGNRDLCLTLTS